MSLHTPRGFTIIELMIVILIVAILATFALPSMRDVVIRMRLKTAAGDLHSSLMLARAEAIKRNGTITISPIGGGTDWKAGWEVKTGATVLSRQDAYADTGFTATDAAYSAPVAISSVSFAGSGRATPSAGTSVAFVLTAPGSSTSSLVGAHDSNIAARCVVLDPSGRAAVRTDQNRNADDGCN